jgi:hypothetical protein
MLTRQEPERTALDIFWGRKLWPGFPEIEFQLCDVKNRQMTALFENFLLPKVGLLILYNLIN